MNGNGNVSVVVNDVSELLENTRSCSELEEMRDLIIGLVENISDNIASNCGYCDYEVTNFIVD